MSGRRFSVGSGSLKERPHVDEASEGGATVHERLPTYEIGDHHVQEAASYIDAGTPLVEFYCCRCRTIKFGIEWFQDHDCPEAK